MKLFPVGQRVLIIEEHNNRSIEGTVIAIPKKNTMVYDNDIIGDPDLMFQWTPDYCDYAENECSINKKAKEKIYAASATGLKKRIRRNLKNPVINPNNNILFY